MKTYEETMAWGAAQYEDAIGALEAAGLPTQFIQTGGMCAALLVTVDDGYTLLVTDGDDTLAWDRADHRGWSVGLYPPGEEGGGEGPVAFAQTERSDVAGLLAIVPTVRRLTAGRNH